MNGPIRRLLLVLGMYTYLYFHVNEKDRRVHQSSEKPMTDLSILAGYQTICTNTGMQEHPSRISPLAMSNAQTLIVQTTNASANANQHTS